MNARDRERDEYIFSERQKGRTFKDIGLELGITGNRVRQVYNRACVDRRRAYFRTHKEEYQQWLQGTWEEQRNFIPID